MRTTSGAALAGRSSAGSESVIWGLWRRRSPIVRREAGIETLPGETAERRSDGVRRYLDQPYCIAGKLIQLPLVFTSFASSILTAHRRLLKNDLIFIVPAWIYDTGFEPVVVSALGRRIGNIGHDRLVAREIDMTALEKTIR